jgi:hypothetical protein
MSAYGFTVEGDGLICSNCADNPLYNGVLEEVEEQGYPDGYTCADCGNTKQVIAYCGDCLYPINECEHGRELKR